MCTVLIVVDTRVDMGAKPSSVAQHHRVVICGPSGAGKDYYARLLSEKGYTFGVSHTTRPMREGETDGVEYHFVDKAEFDKIEFYETVKHGSYHYGLSRKEWDTKQIFILNPEGIRTVAYCGDRNNTLVIYLDIPENVRNVRLVEQRGWTDEELAARSEVDKLSFQDFSDWDVHVTDADHDLSSMIDGVLDPAH